MSFEDILNQWDKDKGSVKKSIKKNVKKNPKKEDKTMSSFLDMYPPDSGLVKTVIEKPTQRQKRRNYRRMKPQEVLDLHGFSLVSAKVELEDFIKRCKRRRIEKILIIHGKGLHSPDGEAVLRDCVKNELMDSMLIGEIGQPSEKEGGAGATWCIIKY